MEDCGLFLNQRKLLFMHRECMEIGILYPTEHFTILEAAIDVS